MTILVAGNAALFDLLGTGSTIPASSEVGQLTGGPLAKGQATPGGAAFIVACVMGELGHDVRLWHPLPKERLDGFPIARLRRAGVDLSFCPIVDEPTPYCLMINTPSGRLAWSSRLSAPEIKPDKLLDGVTHIVFGPVWEAGWSEALLTEASRRDIPTSLFGASVPDTSPHKWHSVILDKAQAEASKPFYAHCVCMTDGPNDIVLTCGSDTSILPTHPIEPVDTTGAGDVFAATFLAHFLNGSKPCDAAKHATRAAARNCLFWGAWKSMSDEIVKEKVDLRDRLNGTLAGTACGDAFGMPNSFLKQPIWRETMQEGPDNSPYHAGYPAGRITDDTEQALALTEAFADGFTKQNVAKRLNDWFVSVGGSDSLAVGPSTKRALEAFQRGEPVEEIGRFGVTNGAPMRISPIGAMAGLKGLSLEQTADLVETACWPTHATSPAISGALSIAWAIASAMQNKSWEDVFEASIEGARVGATRGHWVYSSDIALRIEEARKIADASTTNAELCENISKIVGAGEPCTETIPAAMAICNFAAGDPKLAIELAGNLQGDTDTIAAIAGAVCGAFSGIDAIPEEWRSIVETTNQLDFDHWSDKLIAMQDKG